MGKCTLLACALSLISTCPAVAQVADTTSKTAGATTGTPLDEIIVTARQRSEAVQDIPETVTAFTAADIQKAGIDSVDSLGVLVPNFSVVDSQDAGLVTINIRGIGQVRNGDAPVAIVIDGVQLASPDQIKQPLYDIQQIEILKGPQGALYGRNAIGGAINITTKAPTNQQENEVELGLGNGDDKTVNFNSTGPVIDNRLFYRVSGDFRDFDGLIENVTRDHKADFADDANVRGRLIFQASDDLSFDFRGSWGKLRAGASYYIPLPDNDSNNTSIPVQSQELGVSIRQLSDTSLKIADSTSLGTLTSITAYSYSYVYLREDLTWLPVSPLRGLQARLSNNVSEEVRLVSPSDQPLRYVAGLFYMNEKPDIATNVVIEPATLFRDANTDGDNDAYAAFGQLNYDVLSNVELTAAMRYDLDDRHQTDLLNGGAKSSASFHAWQPKFSASYKFLPESLVYVTYSEGFRSGGFNAPTPAFPLIYKAEKTKNIEVGAKTELLDHRMTVDLSVFHTDFTNQQIFDFIDFIQGLSNIPSTAIHGLDASATYRPIQGLELSFGVGWLHSDITNFNGTSEYVGNKSPFTPEYSANAAIQYTHQIGDHTVTGRLDFSEKRDLYWEVNNLNEQEPVYLVNAHVMFDFNRYQLQLYADNLMDVHYTEEFFSKAVAGTATDIRYPSEPRQYGVKLRITF